MIVTLSEAKAHLRVEFTDEDTAIAGLIAAAESYLEGVGCDVAADPMPAALKQAALLLIAEWYQNREASSRDRAEIPFGVSALINNLREVPL